MTALLLPLVLLNPSWDLAEMARLEAEIFASADALDDAPALSFLAAPELTSLGIDAPERPPPPTPADLKLDALEVPVTLNAAVRGYLDFFQGRGRAIYAKWYARMGRWGPHMLPILEKHGVPPEMIYVAMIESGFNPDAVSHASAVGPWQFVRRTGGAYGLQVNDWVDERRDPLKATDAAARHLKDLHEKLGAWPLVLAAYNAGSGWMRRGIRRANSNDFWRLVEADTLPEQAQRYVPKAMAAMIIGQNPGRYGFGAVRPEPAIEFAVVSVRGELDLKRFARAASVHYDELVALNPELRRGFTPPGGTYALRVPPEAVARADAASQVKSRVLVEHRVRFGERLRHIARDFGVSPSTLRRLNDLTRGDPVEPGSLLLVPRPTGAPDSINELLVLTEPGVDFEVKGRQEIFFPVRWSMPVDEIAAFFGVSPGQVAMWNGLDPAAPVQKGMALRVFAARDFDARRAVTVDRRGVTQVVAGSEQATAALERAQEEPVEKQRYTRYAVRRGDTLWKIARKHGASVAAIREENNLKRGRLRLGQTLRIPVGATPPRASGRAARREAKPTRAESKAAKAYAARQRAKRPVAPKPVAPKATPKPVAAKATPKPKRSAGKGRGMRYTVRPGDTLYQVANRYDVSVRALRERNELPKAVKLRAGQVLYIP